MMRFLKHFLQCFHSEKRVCSALEVIHCIGGEVSVHLGDIISALGHIMICVAEYHECIGSGVFSPLGDIMSASGEGGIIIVMEHV